MTRLVILGSLLLAATPALAMDPVPSTATGTAKAPAPSETVFETFDADKNGSIARNEVPLDHVLAARFAEFDLDKNLALSRAEFESWKQDAEGEGEEAE